MLIIDYIKNNTQQDRQKHIDLSDACIFAVAKRNTQHHKKGTPVKSSAAMKQAKENLKNFLGLKGNTSSNVHTCHKCSHDSSNGVCINPKHLYFGTISENVLDLPEELRKQKASNAAKQVKNRVAPNKKTSAKGGYASSKSASGNINQIKECPYCGKLTKGPAHYNHINNCKEKE